MSETTTVKLVKLKEIAAEWANFSLAVDSDDLDSFDTAEAEWFERLEDALAELEKEILREQ